MISFKNEKTCGNIFKINDFLTVRLKNDRTHIYVKNKRFLHCKHLLINISVNNIENYDDLGSIDEFIANSSHLGAFSNISPITEFWGHCSNLQAWYESGYDTRLLHRNLAFPLLKKLTDVGDPQAKKVFKEEIAKRLMSQYLPVITYLIAKGYLKYLEEEELDSLSIELDNLSSNINLGNSSSWLGLCNAYIALGKFSRAKNILRSLDPFTLKYKSNHEFWELLYDIKTKINEEQWDYLHKFDQKYFENYNRIHELSKIRRKE